MKTLFLSAAAVLALTAASAQAQYPVQPDGAAYGQAGCPTCPTGHVGGHHMGGHHMGGKFSGGFKGLFGGKLFGGIFCNHGSLFGKDSHGGGFGAGGFGAGGFGAGLFGGGGGGPQIPVVDPRMGGSAGQLVFPQHPFVRGPRDYFMLEDR